MALSTRVRLVACLLIAIAAGGVAAERVLPLGPRLDFEVVHSFRLEGQDLYDIRIFPRGGEVIETVRVEVLRGSARVSQPAETHDLAPDTRFQVRINVNATTPVPVAIRVSQEGRVERTYDIELEEEAQ